jgi:hypothetical protein
MRVLLVLYFLLLPHFDLANRATAQTGQWLEVYNPSSFRHEYLAVDYNHRTPVSMGKGVVSRDGPGIYRRSLLQLGLATAQDPSQSSEMSISRVNRQVKEGEALEVRLQSGRFQGEFPEHFSDLEAIAQQHCNPEARVYHDLIKSESQLRHWLQSYSLIWPVDLPSDDTFSRIDLSRCRVLSVDEDLVHFESQSKGVLSNCKFRRFENQWRLVELQGLFDNSSSEKNWGKSKRICRVNWVSSSEARVSDETHYQSADGQLEELSIDSRYYELSDSPLSEIGGEIPVPNYTPVTLRNSQQIKACWLDGRIVRVFDQGHVDDLGGVSFQNPTQSSSRIWMIGTAVVILAGIALVLFRQDRSRPA